MRFISFLYLLSATFVLDVTRFLAADAHGGSLAHTEDSVCGTPDFEPVITKRIMDIAKKKKKKTAIQSRALPSNITVDTYFCVVTDSGGLGDVADSVLQTQIAVLNQNFANSGSRFRFQMQGAQRKALRGASTSSLYNYIDQLALSCRQGGLDALNIFVVPFIQAVGTTGRIIGVAYPFFLTGVSYADGIYILTSNLPGGGLVPADLGITAVHEAGHWFGLIHTFQALPPYNANPCNPSNPNDYISDTPQMNSSSISIRGCPVNRDSCPFLPGLDPTNNFMDYGAQYDSQGKVCKTMFTPQQVGRMQDVWDFYRVQNEICAADEFQFQLQIQFDQNPQYTSWDIKFANGTFVHQSITDGLGAPYDSSNFAGQTITVYNCFLRGTTYIFDIYSSTGRGIASPGYYRLYVDGKVIAQGGRDFTTSKSISFGVSAIASFTPTRKPSEQPTAKATPQPSAQPTAKPTTNNGATPIIVATGNCFSKENTVEVESRGIISINEVQIGDKVRSADGTMVKVYSFGHYNPNARTMYLQFCTQSLLKPLEVSNDHMVFVQGVPTPASKVSIGDTLDSEAGPVKVTMIKVVTRTGAYAPFTTSGTLMINGFAVSSYVTLQEESNVLVLGAYKTPLSMHWLAHVFQTPHRLACLWRTAYCKSVSYTPDGISTWVAEPLRFSQWFVRQNGLLMIVFLVPALFLGLLLYFAEACCLHSHILLIISASAFAMYVIVSDLFCKVRPKTKSKSKVLKV